MKTKKEINYNINKLSEGHFLDEVKKRYTQYEIMLFKDKLKTLNIVLGKPNYQRTIFELTKDELTKLISITSNDDERAVDKVVSANYNGWDCLEITDEDGDIYHIYENLDFSSLHVGYYNQAKFIDTIREMLSMEKPNEFNELFEVIE